MRFQEVLAAAQCLFTNCEDGSNGLARQPANICNTLAQLNPENVLFPGDDKYSDRQVAYFNLQHAELHPTCRYLPSGPYDVRIALKQLVDSETSFAVQSGGHSYNVGASNIDKGVTIDLSRLSSVTLTDDNSAAWVGPGARWRQVYGALDPHGLTMAGGRVADVGVGGYVLGGGFSWYSSQFGWVCDSVLEFEVVTPDGRVLYPSATKHEDLFWALKGSAGGFGIVTAIKMPTIKYNGIYGGMMIYDHAEAPKLHTALHHIAINAEEDRPTQAIMNFVWNRGQNNRLPVASFTNMDGESSSPAMANWTSIPSLVNALHPMTMSEAAEELLGPDLPKQRRTKLALTTRSSEAIIEYLHSTWVERTSNVTVTGETGLGDTVILTMQPLSRPHLAASQKSGNIFPLADEGEALLICTMELYWDSKDQDEYFAQQIREWHDLWVEGLSALDAFPATNWVYPNYAGEWQDIYSEFRLGKNTTDELSKIRQKYDAQGIWKKLVPGQWHF